MGGTKRCIGKEPVWQLHILGVCDDKMLDMNTHYTKINLTF